MESPLKEVFLLPQFSLHAAKICDSTSEKVFRGKDKRLTDKHHLDKPCFDPLY
jgi:hypothetical protein